MLHLIFQNPIESAILQRITKGDAAILLENAAFKASVNQQANLIEKMLELGVQVYVLQEDIQARGIAAQQLLDGICVIDYPALAKLTEDQHPTITWN